MSSWQKQKKSLIFSCMFVCICFSFLHPSFAYKPKNKPDVSHAKPEELKNVGINKSLGQQIDKDLEFVDDNGNKVKLASYFNGDKPVMLSMVYFDCPSLCNFHITGLVDSFKNMDMVAGKDFKFLAVSMNHRETAKDAKAYKEKYLKAYGHVGAGKGWHFFNW